MAGKTGRGEPPPRVGCTRTEGGLAGGCHALAAGAVTENTETSTLQQRGTLLPALGWPETSPVPSESIQEM